MPPVVPLRGGRILLLSRGQGMVILCDDEGRDDTLDGLCAADLPAPVAPSCPPSWPPSWQVAAAQSVLWTLVLDCPRGKVLVRGRVPSPGDLPLRLGPLVTATDGAAPAWTIDLTADGDDLALWVDGEYRASADGANLAVCELLGLLAELNTAPGPVVLLTHAAGLVVKGHPLLLAAPSSGGKTTLATALLGRGATLLSDDTIAVAADHSLAGVATALRIRAGGADLLAPWLGPAPRSAPAGEPRFVAPRTVGRTAAAAGPAAAVILLDHAPGLRPTLTPLTTAEGLMALVGAGASLVGGPNLPRARALARWADATPFLWMSYDTLHQGAEILEAVAAALAGGLPVADAAAVAGQSQPAGASAT
ncbi:hypothetical protein [Nitrospirillum iridis]|uniref:hypothetical protein n=1 Tax=Nitrospirillum iridis TaxID=765888 RepID=UPI0031B62BD0